MAQYLSLEEAARILSVSTSDLMKMREQGGIRGFADRGNWKFKPEDVESLRRSLSADSDPEVPLLDDDDDVGEQPTVISKGADLGRSDSDVKIIGGPDIDLLKDSDSDVKLVGLAGSAGGQNLEGTDPDFSMDSDSDVRLMDSRGAGSGPDSDSDVKLISSEDDASDVTLMSGEQAVPVMPDKHSVLADDDDSGISLDDSSLVGDDSSLMLGGGSGIALDGPTDSGIELTSDDDDEGITLDLGDGSGISLVSDESGISLDVADDSGISLEEDDHSGTIPMMDALSDDSIPETQFEIPPLDDDADSSVFDLDADETGVISASDSVFDLDDESSAELGTSSDSFTDDELDIEEDVFDDEDLDVFDADDDVFDEEEDEFDSRPRGRVVVDSEWGTGVFAGLTVASLLLVVCGVVMIDLVNNMANASEPVSQPLLNMLGGLYK